MSGDLVHSELSAELPFPFCSVPPVGLFLDVEVHALGQHGQSCCCFCETGCFELDLMCDVDIMYIRTYVCVGFDCLRCLSTDLHFSFFCWHTCVSLLSCLSEAWELERLL